MERRGACKAARADGRPCGSVVVLTSGYCPMHDPDRQAQMAAARVKGGEGRATTARVDRLVPATLRPVVGKLLDALDGVEDGSLSPRQGAAMAAIASALVRIYDVGVLTDRVVELEKVAAERRGA